MTNQMKNVPELRFPEFDGEWEEGTIKSLVHGNLSDGDWINKEYLLPNGKYRIIQTGNISVGKYLNKEKSSKFISQSSYDELKANEVFPGDILISRLADPAGRSIIMPNINWKMVTSVDVAIIRPNKKFESYFLISILNTDKKLYDISKLVSGTSHKRISRKNLEKVKIIYPKIQEQQKIGYFFSKLDRQIELEEQKLAKLEEQKKGYMQKIFSQELRFKDENGNDYPEWEIKKLMQIAKVKTGSKNVQDNIQDGKYKFFDRSVEVKYLNTFDFDETAIIYPGEGSKFLPRYFSGKYSLHQRAYSIYDININNNYLYYYLSLQNNHFLKYAVGSTVKSLRMSGFDKLKVMVPKNSEQEKIGSFFKNLDEFIEKQANKVELLKQRKQSFLQKMFV